MLLQLLSRLSPGCQHSSGATCLGIEAAALILPSLTSVWPLPRGFNLGKLEQEALNRRLSALPMLERGNRTAVGCRIDMTHNR